MDAHEELLSQWAKREHHLKKGFISDGIIDESRWRHASRKVLLLLKEAYNGPGDTSDWDLRTAIRDEWRGPKYKIWKTAAYWCYVTQKTTKSHVPEFPEDDCDAAAESLLSSAAVNIKKSNGKSTSNYDDIQLYASLDGQLIKKQITLINPDIIICGNCWRNLSHLWHQPRPVYGNMVWQVANYIVIDFWHPANWYPHWLNYYTLGCLLQNSLVV